ncbi:hypothetical protein V1515DRAFT_446902 [Lipomyces mesembrius]
MPFMVAKYSIMQTLLSMFAGTKVNTKLKGNCINNPCNLFCTDHSSHLQFDKFDIGVEYLDERYFLRKLSLNRLPGPIALCQDGEEVFFGNGPHGDTVDWPDGELFNIHYAIGKVLHASGAGEVIDKILRDEEDYNDGIVANETSAARISAFSLKMALKEVKVVDGNESPDCGSGLTSSKQQEGSKGVLRTTTNSQSC